MKRLTTFALMVLFVLATAHSAFALFGSKFEDEVEKEKEAVKLVREVQRGGYGVVTVDELKSWMDAGKDMLIIDTMPFEASYKKEHVPGAKQFLFPIPELESWGGDELGGSQDDYVKLLGPDKDRLIVIYCGFVKCTRSHNGAMWAKKLGYTNIYRFPGGIFAWKGADFESESAE